MIRGIYEHIKDNKAETLATVLVAAWGAHCLAEWRMQYAQWVARNATNKDGVSQDTPVGDTDASTR